MAAPSNNTAKLVGMLVRPVCACACIAQRSWSCSHSSWQSCANAEFAQLYDWRDLKQKKTCVHDTVGSDKYSHKHF